MGIENNIKNILKRNLIIIDKLIWSFVGLGGFFTLIGILFITMSPKVPLPVFGAHILIVIGAVIVLVSGLVILLIKLWED